MRFSRSFTMLAKPAPSTLGHYWRNIMNVSDLKMGSAKIEQDHVVIQTIFELTAFVAPPESKPAGAAAQ